VGEFDLRDPHTLVLDRQGVNCGQWLGYRPGCEHEMEQLIVDLLCTKYHRAARMDAEAGSKL